MVPRRLEDRIYALIGRAVRTSDPGDLDVLFSQLRASLREHILRLRKMASAKLPPPRRRKTDLDESIQAGSSRPNPVFDSAAVEKFASPGTSAKAAPLLVLVHSRGLAELRQEKKTRAPDNISAKEDAREP